MHDCPPSGVLTIGNLTSSCEQRVQSSINRRQLYGRDYAGAGIHSLINWLAEENEIFRCLLLTLISLKLLLLMDDASGRRRLAYPEPAEGVHGYMLRISEGSVGM